MEHLDGLSYLNLGCCANTGFNGYNDIAKLALEHAPNLRAVVLYLEFNNLPVRRWAAADQEMGATKIHDAFVGPWAFIKLPSMGLRPIATGILYRRPARASPHAFDMMRSVKEEGGWWAEQDQRLVGARREQFFRTRCGDAAHDYVVTDLSSASGEFLPLLAFESLAALAKSRNASAIIVFHPHPCDRFNEETLRALRSAVTTLRAKYSNVSVYPPELFEHWPQEVFVEAAHLHVGYERYSSRRLGRFVADALGLPVRAEPQAPPPLPVALIRPGEAPVWTNGHMGAEWRLHGLAATQSANEPWRVAETPATGRHSLETTISGLVPDRYYLVMLTYKPVGDRIVSLALKSVATGDGGSNCNASASQANRYGDFYDGGMNLGADGSFVCWGIIKLTQDRAVLGIELWPQNANLPYRGDGQSGLIIQDVALFMRSSPDVLIDSDMQR
jgi:hypothetical protein